MKKDLDLNKELYSFQKGTTRFYLLMQKFQFILLLALIIVPGFTYAADMDVSKVISPLQSFFVGAWKIELALYFGIVIIWGGSIAIRIVILKKEGLKDALWWIASFLVMSIIVAFTSALKKAITTDGSDVKSVISI